MFRGKLSAPIRKYGDVFFGRSSGGETIGFLLELDKQAVKIVAGEGPLEGLSGFLIALLEAGDLTFESGRRGEVVGIEDLALDDREIDLDLIEPAGMHRGVDENYIWPFGPQTIGGASAAMRGAVVGNPEYAAGGSVRLFAHDLRDQAVEGSNAGFAFAAAE